jgi:hypothetical protein
MSFEVFVSSRQLCSTSKRVGPPDSFEVNMFRGDGNEVSFSKSVGSYALTDWVVYLSQTVGQGQTKTRREEKKLYKEATEPRRSEGRIPLCGCWGELRPEPLRSCCANALSDALLRQGQGPARP